MQFISKSLKSDPISEVRAGTKVSSSVPKHFPSLIISWKVGFCRCAKNSESWRNSAQKRNFVHAMLVLTYLGNFIVSYRFEHTVFSAISFNLLPSDQNRWQCGVVSTDNTLFTRMHGHRYWLHVKSGRWRWLSEKQELICTPWKSRRLLTPILDSRSWMKWLL